jgi:hypothetical protein
MSGSESSSSSSATAAASRKRALSPAAAQAADATAASQPQPNLLSTILPPSPQSARNDPLPAAFIDGARPAGPPAPVARRWSDRSPAQRCFSDGLALAFSFLSMGDLILAAGTCKAWRMVAANKNAARVRIRNILATRSRGGPEAAFARLQSLASSPFRHHVRALTHTAARIRTSSLCFMGHLAWGLSHLKLLQRLPQLRRISEMLVDLTAPWHASDADMVFAFPPLLRSIDFHLFELRPQGNFQMDSRASMQRQVLLALRPCHSLTELSITMHDSSELVLDGLLELSTLQILTVDIDIKHSGDDDHIEARFSEAQIGVVKQLPNLRRLTLRDSRRDLQLGDLFMNGWPRWLCSLPHRLQRLEELDLGRLSLKPQHVELLHVGLPALTALEPDSIHHSALILLPKFASCMRILNLRVDIGFAAVVSASLFLPHLTPCSRLSHLTLRDCTFSEAEAENLCRALPLLRWLHLIGVGWPSFESLRHLPLLETLQLNRAAAFPLHVDAAHLQPLQRLRRFILIRVVLPDESLVAALRPPSALLTALVEFEYSPDFQYSP